MRRRAFEPGDLSMASLWPALLVIASGKNRRLAAKGATVRVIDKTPTHCVICGGQLYPRGQYQRFCSKSCRAKRHHAGERPQLQPRKQPHVKRDAE